MANRRVHIPFNFFSSNPDLQKAGKDEFDELNEQEKQRRRNRAALAGAAGWDQKGFRNTNVSPDKLFANNIFRRMPQNVARLTLESLSDTSLADGELNHCQGHYDISNSEQYDAARRCHTIDGTSFMNNLINDHTFSIKYVSIYAVI